jgi:UDP-GlcNAc:undecaprenyl-phosphate GlcNAc-1-phosphate transferase
VNLAAVQNLLALTLGFGITVMLIPRIIELAHRHEVLDRPDGDRRLHNEAVPRLGGIAIFAGSILAAGALMVLSQITGETPSRYGSLLPGLLIGCSIVFATGLADDLRGMSPRMKLLAQTTAAAIVVAYGFQVDAISLSPGSGTLSLGIFAIPVTILWIVGMTNAFNLIDGADGLAGTFSLIALTAILVVELYLHDASTLVITFAIMGSVFAFLRYNRAPATIFLGDSGSMTLGFFLSIRLVVGSTSEGGVTYALVPIFALAFPLLDTFIAIARRWIRGHPLSRADGRHIHHQILALGVPVRGAVEILGLFFGTVAALGLSISFAPAEFTLAFFFGALTLMFVGAVYGTRILGYSEFSELGRSVGSVFRNARTVVREKLYAAEVADRIRLAKSFEEIRVLLDELVEEVRVLDVEVIAVGPSMHGPSRQQISPADQLPIRLDFPFLWESEGGTRERPRPGGHPASERIATRIGPALESWFREHREEISPTFWIESAPIYRKTPSAVRRMEI